MSVKVKNIKPAPEAKAPEKAILIPYFMLQVISDLIGKFPCSTYEDFELIQGKKEALNKQVQALLAKSGNDITKANAMLNDSSELTKTEFAWMDQDAFRQLVPRLGLNAEQVGVLKFWVVKDPGRKEE